MTRERATPALLRGRRPPPGGGTTRVSSPEEEEEENGSQKEHYAEVSKDSEVRIPIQRDRPAGFLPRLAQPEDRSHHEEMTRLEAREGGEGRQEGSGGRQDDSGGRQEGYGGRKDGYGGRQDGYGGRKDGSGGRQDGSGVRQEGSGGRGMGSTLPTYSSSTLPRKMPSSSSEFKDGDRFKETTDRLFGRKEEPMTSSSSSTLPRSREAKQPLLSQMRETLATAAAAVLPRRQPNAFMQETRASFRRKSLIQGEGDKEKPAPLLARTGSLRRSVGSREESKGAGGLARSLSLRQKQQPRAQEDSSAESRRPLAQLGSRQRNAEQAAEQDTEGVCTRTRTTLLTVANLLTLEGGGQCPMISPAC